MVERKRKQCKAKRARAVCTICLLLLFLLLYGVVVGRRYVCTHLFPPPFPHSPPRPPLPTKKSHIAIVLFCLARPSSLCSSPLHMYSRAQTFSISSLLPRPWCGGVLCCLALPLFLLSLSLCSSSFFFLPTRLQRCHSNPSTRPARRNKEAPPRHTKRYAPQLLSSFLLHPPTYVSKVDVPSWRTARRPSVSAPGSAGRAPCGQKHRRAGSGSGGRRSTPLRTGTQSPSVPPSCCTRHTASSSFATIPRRSGWWPGPRRQQRRRRGTCPCPPPP